MSESSRITILDHGYLELVESWGSDEGIVEAARMSTSKGFQGWGPIVTKVRQCRKCMVTEDEPTGKWECCAGYLGAGAVEHEWGEPSVERSKPGDEKLLRYLWEHRHTSPFEHAGATFEVQAPIFVLREWMRSRTQSYSEMSSRYTTLPDFNYIPTVERLMLAGDSENRQAGTVKGAAVLTEQAAIGYRILLSQMYHNQQMFYERVLADGVPKELARIHLPVGRYSRMRASANLWNWLHFLGLRCALDSQWEIRSYAKAVRDMLDVRFPRTLALFMVDAKVQV